MPVCCVLPTACCLKAALKPFPGFRQELFGRLYDFFHRYFSPSGSIYFQHTPAHKNIYEKVYTDDRDVVLFWKTHMLYYVKTDRLFNSLEGRDSNARASRSWIDARPCARYNCESTIQARRERLHAAP